ncbi:hypothetical protein BDM02DRAFT_3191838 [Thelephora ganbajun]|uniref:Uncharacterized protein n=1 Tax=Thelephora ganbajun TaxID=370292 RepID=A0ACB6Z1P7_THEGA|nr:hypothetical protein BDM02DRAFT_3191838 [Thelephora ganbajun]
MHIKFKFNPMNPAYYSKHCGWLKKGLCIITTWKHKLLEQGSHNALLEPTASSLKFSTIASGRAIDAELSSLLATYMFVVGNFASGLVGEAAGAKVVVILSSPILPLPPIKLFPSAEFVLKFFPFVKCPSKSKVSARYSSDPRHAIPAICVHHQRQYEGVTHHLLPSRAFDGAPASKVAISRTSDNTSPTTDLEVPRHTSANLIYIAFVSLLFLFKFISKFFKQVHEATGGSCSGPYPLLRLENAQIIWVSLMITNN